MISKAQNSLYWREWSAAKKSANLEDADRHKLHIRALSQDKSHTHFTNRDLDKVLAEFRALSRPDSLTAQLAQANQPRKRLLWWINNECVESYVAEVCQNKFGTTDHESLNYEQLKQLHMTLKHRPKAMLHQPAKTSTQAEPINLASRYETQETETSNQPF